MQALTLENGALYLRTDWPVPVPAADEALIRVDLAGICSTDLEMAKGYVPAFSGVLGHEFVGTVVETAVPGWQGKRVVGSINIGCNVCAVCLGQGPEHCLQRQALGIHGRDGVFAEYVTLPVRNLFVVPDRVPNEAAVFTEPLAAAVRIREQVVAAPSAKTAVIGPGRLGLLVAQVLALAGTDLIVAGRSEQSLRLPQKWGLATALVSELPDFGFDLVVEVTGNDAGFAQALRLTRPRGTIVLKSTFAAASELNLAAMVVNELTVVGSRCGPFAPALRLLAGQDVDVRSLVEADYALADALTAFEHAAQPGVRKILIRP